MCLLRGRDSNPRPSGYEPDELTYCSTPQYVRGSTKCGDRTFLLFLYGKLSEKPEIIVSIGNILIALCVSYLSTCFWQVMPVPAIFIDFAFMSLTNAYSIFHSTISLADYSQELPHYSFIPIKDGRLAAFHPLCSYLRGLRHFSSFATVDLCFLLVDAGLEPATYYLSHNCSTN